MARRTQTALSFKSYASLDSRGLGTVAEFWHLYRHKTADIAGTIASVVSTCEEMEQSLAESFDLTLRNLNVLEVGAGQRLLRAQYFSRKNPSHSPRLRHHHSGFDPRRIGVFSELMDPSVP